jgi:alpha-glucosidase
MQSIRLFMLLPLLFGSLLMRADSYTLSSPDGELALRIEATDELHFAVDLKGKEIMWYSPISLTVNGRVLGQNPVVRKATTREVREVIRPVWGIRSEIQDDYNELTLQMEGEYAVIFRAYNDGVAYRFRTDFPGVVIVNDEHVNFRFLEDHRLLAHVVGNFQTSYEKLYTDYKVSEVVEKEFISLPLVMDQGDVKIAFAEADLYDYPGMYLKRQGENNRHELQGLWPQYPTKVEQGGWSQFNLRVTERADFLAQTEGKRDFPWRVLIIGDEDIDLADNDLVYQLARPSEIDTDWIRPGKVAWDWWNAWNLEGVDFETGVNNQTYEYYIDFAAKHGLEYIIMDEGWSDQFNLMLLKPGIDVKKVIEYADRKGVKVILWAVWHTIDRQMEEALDMFEAWGVAGIKVDFIDRDDQLAVNFYERLAREAAKRKLLVDYHGCSKPTGLHRTYPNLINYEGVRGNEYNKFSTGETPGHNVDLVYTRMLTGPMDYTPGAIRNSTKGNFLTDNENPMSYGTRAHQLGMYVVYYSPLQMLCDAPTAYEKYPDIMEFLSRVPVSWDDTKVLAGELGKYVVIARRKGDVWYLGALTDWDEREITVDLADFLPAGDYEAHLYLDGVNAHRKAEDYQVKTQAVSADESLTVTLKPGGGMAGWIGEK